MARAQYLRIVDAAGNRIPKVKASIPDYEGAAYGRRMSTWGTSTAGPSTAVYNNLAYLRSRARELVRNNPQVDGALDTLVSNLIGSGISPRWQLPKSESETKKELQRLWADWVPEADADGLLDFYGLETLICREVIEAGECFVRLRPRLVQDGLSVPLQLQVLEADYCDETYNTIAPNGNEVRCGIEIDRLGRRVAYWMWQEHPGEAFLFTRRNFDRVRIPASQLLHVFKPLRAGQLRGLPWAKSIITLMYELDGFDDAELVRKKTAALFGGFIQKPPDEDPDAPPVLGRRGTDDDNSNKVIEMEPGTFPELPPGYEVAFSEPADVGGNYKAFTQRNERKAARGFGGLTYEKFTGDLTGVNYSSIRAGNLEFQRQCKQFIYNVLAYQCCRSISYYWLDQAILSGAIKLPGYAQDKRKYRRVTWTIDGWPWVDPVKDQEASKSAVRNGNSTRTRECAERGWDVEEIDEEQAADNERADALGLIYDTDPRKVAGKGQSAQGDSDAKKDVLVGPAEASTIESVGSGRQ